MGCMYCEWNGNGETEKLGIYGKKRFKEKIM